MAQHDTAIIPPRDTWLPMLPLVLAIVLLAPLLVGPLSSVSGI